jgi:hypothetical protein
MYGDANVAAYLPTYTGDITGGNVTLTNDITARYFVGDGGYLSNIQYSNLIGAYSNANVANYLPTYTGLATAGNVAVTGNVVANGIVQAEMISAGTGNILVTGTSITTTTSNIVIDPGNDGLSGGNLIVQGNLQVAGNVTYVNTSTVTTDNLIWQAANTATNPLLADGGGLAVGPAGNSYATWLYSATDDLWVSNIGVEIDGGANINGNITGVTNVTATGSVSANAFIGDGGRLSNIQYSNLIGAYGDSNVAAYLPTFTGNLTAGNATVTDTVFAHYFVGDGGTLSNINYANVTGAYSNSNVSAYLPTNTSNVSAAYFTGNGSLLTGMYGNADVAQYLPTYTGSLSNLAGNVVTTANIQGQYLLGNGAFITGLPTQYSNANVAAYLPINTSNIAGGILTVSAVSLGTGNIQASNNLIYSTTANIVIDPGNDGLSGGNLIVQGNLQVKGNVTYVNTSTVTSSNLIWQAANTATTPTMADGGGLAVGPAGNSYATWLYSATDNIWVSNIGAEINGNANITNITTSSISANSFSASSVNTTSITAGTISGDGGNISNIQYTSIVGAYGNSNVAAYLPTYNGDIGANIVTANYFYGDGSNLTGLPASYSNADVAAYLPTYTGNIAAFDVTASNAVTAGNVILNTNGALVFADGTSLSSAPAAIPAMYFTAVANANNQVFSNTFIGSYEDPTDMLVFINGAMIESTYYSLVGNNLTVNLPLSVGDSVDIARNFAANVIAGFYQTNSIEYNSANQTPVIVSGLAARWLGEAGQVQLSLLSGSSVAHAWTGMASQSSGGVSAVSGSASLSAGSWIALNGTPVTDPGDSVTVNIVNTVDNKVYQLIAVYAGTSGGSITLTQIA